MCVCVCMFHFKPPILAQLMMMMINFNQLCQITAVLGTILQRCPDNPSPGVGRGMDENSGCDKDKDSQRVESGTELRFNKGLNATRRRHPGVSWYPTDAPSVTPTPQVRLGAGLTCADRGRAACTACSLANASGKVWRRRYHISSCITGATLSVQDYPNVLNPDKWLNATFPLVPFFAEDENRVHKKHFL